MMTDQIEGSVPPPTGGNEERLGGDERGARVASRQDASPRETRFFNALTWNACGMEP